MKKRIFTAFLLCLGLALGALTLAGCGGDGGGGGDPGPRKIILE